MDVLYESGLLQVARTYQPPGLRLVGDVDAFAVPALKDALRTLARSPEDIHLHLAEVKFMDVTAFELVVSAARSLPEGRRIVLHALSPHLRRVMAVVGWDTVPGLTFADERAAEA